MSKSSFYEAIYGIPEDILKFFTEVFDMYEVRKRVGKSEGIIFEVRSNESNHNIPHIHAKYGKYQVSIEIKTGKVLVGNLPKTQMKKASNWVLDNSDRLMTEWKNFTISAKLSLHESRLR